ncbi:MAG: prolyl oligopeptidase family serine peptidase, partial [bacterium]
ADQSSLKYPATARSAQSDDLSGVLVPDPYRWLEAVTSPEVRAWVSAQNALTESFLSHVPRRQEIQDRLARAWAYSKFGAPFAGGERLFYYENSGLENQPALYVQDKAASPPRVLLDPNAFSRDGLMAIVDQAASPDGRSLAYAVSTQGSAWRVVRVRDVRTGQDGTDELQGIKDGPISWTKDARGFFYVRSDISHNTTNANAALLSPDGRQQIYYHRTGRPQSDDHLVFESAAHPDWRLRADVSEDGQYLVITARTGTDRQNRLYLIDLDNPKRPNLGAPIVKLFDTADALYEFVSNVGPIFYIRTTKGAPRVRLVAVDINTPDENHWTTVIRETFDPLIHVERVDDRFVAHRLRDAHSVLELYALDGGVRGVVPLPGVGTVTELNGHGDNREFYFSYSSFLQSTTISRFDLDTKSVVPVKEPHADTALAGYETTQLFFTSKDGTRVPMFITARRGITLDGTHPTLLAGDGSFDVSETPQFSPTISAWLQLGGIYATANVRGGGEYGRGWHVAATGVRKQVSIDDFVAAAEFLISQRYTRPSSLAITGHGAGALLAGASMTQRPELFGAVLLDAALLDMARFTRFAVGASWIPEFGSPDRSADLRALLAYSPVHNLRPEVRYPPVLLTAGEHDDVVTPAHSYKFAAGLQSMQSAVSTLLRVDYDTGFGPGTPTARQLALDGDRLTFLVNALHMAR